MSARPGLRAGAASATLLFAAHAAADETSAARRATAAREMDRPYTMAELSSSVLALPTKGCLKTFQDCAPGDFSLSFGIHNLYRYHWYGIGAGIEWANTLSRDEARGAAELGRAHSRSYFLVEVLFRYYFLQSKDWDGWVGATLGGVVVNDSWTVRADRMPYADTDLVGPRAATIGTEGLSGGISGGAEWSFFRNWSLGLRFRYASWLFPPIPQRSPTLDVASVSGRVDVLSLGLVIAYRIAM